MTDNVKNDLAGRVYPQASLPTMVATSPGLDGSIVPTTTLGRSITRLLAGSLAFIGIARKAVARIFVGRVYPQASLPTMVITSPGLEGALNFVGTTSKAIGRILSGALTFAGTISKSIARILTGALSFVGQWFHPITPATRKYTAPAENRTYTVESD